MTDTSLYSKHSRAKVLIPQKSDEVIHRQRLIDLLHDSIHLRVQIVEAPPGYGKTTLLADFVSELDASTCWYTMDVSDQDPRILLEGILESVRLQFPDFGHLTESRLRAVDSVSSNTAQLADILAKEMHTDIPEYFVLVWEDFHAITDSPEARALVDHLIDYAPENCHIIISSRSPVESPALAKTTIKRLVARLDRSHLSFTPTEVEELLDTRFHISLSEELARKLVDDTDGWIVGILLSAYNLQSGSPGTDVTKFSQRDVFQYLTAEIYERQPPDVQEFLLASSILDDVSPDILDGLLGLPDCRRLLSEVERRNLFIFRTDGAEKCYRYHSLFREFLQAKLMAENHQYYSLLHYKAGRLFEELQRWNEAVTHFVFANKYQDTLRVIKAAGQYFLDAGKWATVAKWIEALPPNIRLSEPDIGLLHAQSLIYLGKTDEAGRVLTYLLGAVKDEEHWLCRAKALSWRSAAFRLAGHFKEARKDVTQAIAILQQYDGPADTLGEAYNRLAYICKEQGQFEVALKHLRRALRCYTSIFNTSKMAEVHNVLGIVYKLTGDLTRANTHFEHARQAYERAGNSGALASVLCNIANIYQRRGQYDSALKMLRRALDKAQETGYLRTEAGILINMAEVLRDLDSYEEALDKYHEGLNLARQVMESYFVAWATAGMGETYRLSGDRDKAEVLIRGAISLSEEQGQGYEAAMFAIQLGIIAYERYDFQTAMSVLNDCYTRLSEIGDKDASARACLHLAQASFLTKKYDLAVSWLKKVSALVDELGYDDFLAVEARNATLLIQYGVSKGVGGDLFTRVMDKMRKRHSMQIKRATGMVPTISTCVPRCDVEVYTLGETKVIVNSRQVTETEWRSSRAMELFIYLLCHGRLGQTKEQITTALWPDLSPARATSNFHINLYRARRAVSPSVFTLEQGHYQLNPDISIYSDVAEFERLISQSENLSDDIQEKAAHLKQAIHLYRGQFMVGFYNEWTEQRRREIEDQYLRTLSSLAIIRENHSDYKTAIELLEKYLDINPYHEEVYHKIIKLHLARGDKVAAEQVYWRYAHTFTTEMGLAPRIEMENTDWGILMTE